MRAAENNPELREDAVPTQLFPVASSAGNLITAVDRCWVCNEVFPKYGGMVHGLVQEFHHPVPRAIGGNDGPTVSLCSGHHAIAHAVAYRVQSNKPFSDLLSTRQSSLPSLVDRRIMKLAEILVRSTSLLTEDPNRRVRQSFSLSNPDNERLKSLAKSNRVSCSVLIERLVQEYLNRELPPKRSHRN